MRNTRILYTNDATKDDKCVNIRYLRISKINMARKFISKGNKVKVTLKFRGREMAHMQSTKHVLDDFAEKLLDIAVIEKPAKLEGKSIMMVLTEKK